MKNPNLSSLLGVIIAAMVGVGISIAGGQQSVQTGGIPVFWLAIGIIYLVQWVAFIPAYIRKSERFFDLTGSLTYTSVTTLTLLLIPNIDRRAVLLLVLITVWATRLGTFLFTRVQEAGKDDRFDEIKLSFTRFLLTWTLQGLWITLTVAAALAAIASITQKNLDWFALIGFLIWLAGFFIELIADVQKKRFKAVPDNRGKFINSGLWAWSRHPNYFGEILLWTGVALIALPVLKGWALITLISPFWVIIQLTLISGIPMLEAKADKKWGGQEDYESYKQNTSVLIPRPPSKQK